LHPVHDGVHQLDASTTIPAANERLPAAKVFEDEGDLPSAVLQL
jgi:hypothetical protein